MGRSIVLLWFSLIILLAEGVHGYRSYLGVCINQIEADCRFENFTALPEELHPNVTSLDVSFNRFRLIPRSLTRYKYLNYLNFSHNQISSLSHSSFDGLENLWTLDLTYNSFTDWTDIKSETFLSTNSLNYLSFSHNPLRVIQRSLRIPSLNILKLVNCSIESIDGWVLSDMAELKELHLGQNPIKTLNTTFRSSSLKYMDLSNCNLTIINPSVFSELDQLETLVVTNNKGLRNFTATCNSLLYLDLSDCTLENIPGGQLKNVYTLTITNNFLRRIYENSFDAFDNLEMMNLSINGIYDIHENAFQGLDHIKILDLSYNTLTKISKYLFQHNEKLEFLNLSHNYLQTINGLSVLSLRELDLRFCRIYRLYATSLSDMANLSTLHLSHNLISFVPDYLNAPNLAHLDLSYCRIKSISNLSFTQMTSLNILNLADNFLTSVSPKDFPYINKLILKNNPWRCECANIKSMYEFLTLRQLNDPDDLICDSPEAVKGKSWFRACSGEWMASFDNRDTLWWYSVGLIALVLFLILLVLFKRRLRKLKEQQYRIEDQQRREEELQAIRRMERRQREMRHEASQNAPDAREPPRPPSYHEALLLPKLDASHPSLASLQTLSASTPDVSREGKPRRKRRRRRKSHASIDNLRTSRAMDSENSEAERHSDQGINRQTLESDF